MASTKAGPQQIGHYSYSDEEKGLNDGVSLSKVKLEKKNSERIGISTGAALEMQHEAYEDSDRMLPTGLLLKDANAAIRLEFVRKVYGLLSVQLILTAIIAAPISMAAVPWLERNVWLLWFSMAMSIAMICTFTIFPATMRSYPSNYFVLFGFTAFEAILVGFVSANYTWQSVLLCTGLTAGIFLGLTAFACKTTVDFTGLGPYLFAGLLALTAWGFVMSLFVCFGAAVKWSLMLYDLAGIVMFVFYIIYDTQLIIGGSHKQHEFCIDDYAFAALSLYLDIIQLFLHILRMLGENRGE